jgi:hypothetical protein
MDTTARRRIAHDIRVMSYPVGIEQFVAETDRLIADGILKPVWARVVRDPAFMPLVSRVFADSPPSL